MKHFAEITSRNSPGSQLKYDCCPNGKHAGKIKIPSDSSSAFRFTNMLCLSIGQSASLLDVFGATRSIFMQDAKFRVDGWTIAKFENMGKMCIRTGHSISCGSSRRYKIYL